MTSPRDKDLDGRLGRMAVEAGRLSERQLEECLLEKFELEAAGRSQPLGEIMLQRGFVDRGTLDRWMTRVSQIPGAIPGFEILEKVGEGGMACVYRARQTSSGRIVALKVLGGEAAEDRGLVQRFLREARAMARLSHPNLIMAFDTGEAAGKYFLAMEFIDGETLEALLRRERRLTEARAVEIMRDVARGLERIHAAGMVHRDLKPANIMISREGVVKLGDLGLVRSVEPGEAALTRAGFMMGTPLYASPEQIRGDANLDARSDIYSFGATFYAALVGQPPFMGDDVGVIVRRHLSEEPRPPRALAPSLSAAVSDACLKMLRKKPAERPASALSLLEELGGPGPPPATATARQTRRVEIRTHRRTVSPARSATGIGVIAAGVAVAVAVVGFLVLAPRGSSAPRRATPPPRAAEAPEPPPLETPAAPQVFSRGTDLSRAKQLIEKGDWIAARDELRTLRGRAQEAAEIDRLLAEVERRLEARAASARAAEEAKQRMDKGEWEAARGLLGPIAAEDAEARACIEKCRREIEAGSEIVKLDEMKAQGSWSDIVKLGGRVESDFGDTAAFAAARGSIHQARDEAKRELEAQDLLTGAREGRAQARWDRVLEKLAQLDRLSQTRTASGAREEMDGLRREAVQEIDRGQVQQMTQAWDAAMALVKEKKWAEAKAALLKLREVLGQTQFFRDRERTWKTAVDECDQEIARARDREAAELWKEAQGKMREEDPKPALAALKRLVEEFAETRWFQSRRRMIESKIAELEKRAAAPPPSSPAPLFDFEAGPGDWYPDTGGGLPKGTAEAVEGGYESAKAVRIRIERGGSGTGSWSSMYLRVNGLDAAASAAGVGFWAKSGTKERMVLRFAIDEGPTQKEVLYQRIEVGPEWQQIRVMFQDLKVSWGPGGNGRVDRERVRGIGFDAGEGGRDLEIWVDRIELIKR